MTAKKAAQTKKMVINHCVELGVELCKGKASNIHKVEEHCKQHHIVCTIQNETGLRQVCSSGITQTYTLILLARSSFLILTLPVGA